MIEIMGVKYLTDKEAAQRYGYSRSWFQQSRYKKTSPPYIKMPNGRVCYPIDKVDEWFKEKMAINE